MKFEDSLTFLLLQLVIVFRNNLQKLLNKTGLHSGQVFVLISLWERDQLTQVDLARNLNLTPPTINKMVKSLEKSGFVECKKCTLDGRMIRVRLTDKGLETKSIVEEQWLKLETESFSNLTPTEKLMLFHLFDKVKTNLNDKVANRQSSS